MNIKKLLKIKCGSDLLYICVKIIGQGWAKITLFLQILIEFPEIWQIFSWTLSNSQRVLSTNSVKLEIRDTAVENFALWRMSTWKVIIYIRILILCRSFSSHVYHVFLPFISPATTPSQLTCVSAMSCGAIYSSPISTLLNATVHLWILYIIQWSWWIIWARYTCNFTVVL